MRELLNELYAIEKVFADKLCEIRNFTHELSTQHSILHAVSAVVNCDAYNLHRWAEPASALMERLEAHPSKPTRF